MIKHFTEINHFTKNSHKMCFTKVSENIVLSKDKFIILISPICPLNVLNRKCLVLFIYYISFIFHDHDNEHIAGATGRQGMLTPRWRLIPPLFFFFRSVYGLFWIFIEFLRRMTACYCRFLHMISNTILISSRFFITICKWYCRRKEGVEEILHLYHYQITKRTQYKAFL